MVWWWALLGWLVISPALAVLLGTAIRLQDVAQVPVRADQPVEAPEEQPEPRTSGALVPAVAAG